MYDSVVQCRFYRQVSAALIMVNDRYIGSVPVDVRTTLRCLPLGLWIDTVGVATPLQIQRWLEIGLTGDLDP
jgi:hypothetical protein